MRFMPILGTFMVPFRKLAVSYLVTVSGNRGQDRIQGFKVNVHDAFLVKMTGTYWLIQNSCVGFILLEEPKYALTRTRMYSQPGYRLTHSERGQALRLDSLQAMMAGQAWT